MSKKILIVDNEPKIVDSAGSYLASGGYKVCAAFDGKQALQAFEREKPDMVVLDLTLPKIEGRQVCRAIRQKSRVPIIMLTANADEESILEGLETGADDYITKPFSPRQLLARVNAIFRRLELDGHPVRKMSWSDGLEIDFATRAIKKNGIPVKLTPNEFKLLTTLAQTPGKVFTRDELIEIALGRNFDGYDRTVDSHIKNLRQKIETDNKNPIYVITVFGVGYKFGGI